jgi:MmeI, helicase spacer domain/MmeI, N-terminal domain
MARRKKAPDAPQVALPAITPQQFVDKWRGVAGREMAGYAENFIDICHMVGHQTPMEAEPSQSFFCFQKSVKKDTGEQGFADVFYQRNFGWEYKGSHKDLEAAYRQLLQYRENLANPPLLIVSDFEQIVIRTNFTNTVTKKYVITLDDLLTPEPVSGTSWSAIELLRRVFLASHELNPGLTPEDVTKEAAAKFAKLADFLRGLKGVARRRKEDIPSDERIARFLTRLIFCMFASDVGLLPAEIISQIVRGNRAISPNLTAAFSSLFKVMQTGGLYGAASIYHFNGGLFSDDEALTLWSDEVDELLEVDTLDWSNIEPSIFGTLFERVIDPSRRMQIGAHYTSRTDIETIVQPVLMTPLEREWSKIEADVAGLNLFKTGPGVVERRTEARKQLQGFIDRLASVRVLDPPVVPAISFT